MVRTMYVLELHLLTYAIKVLPIYNQNRPGRYEGVLYTTLLKSLLVSFQEP